MAFPAVASDMRSRLSAADMIGEAFMARSMEYAPWPSRFGVDAATQR